MTTKLTKEQVAIIGAYTGVVAGRFSDLHECAEKIMCRPIFTHEFASKQMEEELKQARKKDFLAIAAD